MKLDLLWGGESDVLFFGLYNVLFLVERILIIDGVFIWRLIDENILGFIFSCFL